MEKSEPKTETFSAGVQTKFEPIEDGIQSRGSTQLRSVDSDNQLVKHSLQPRNFINTIDMKASHFTSNSKSTDKKLGNAIMPINGTKNKPPMKKTIEYKLKVSHQPLQLMDIMEKKNSFQPSQPILKNKYQSQITSRSPY